MKEYVGAMDRWAVGRRMVVSALLLMVLWLGGCGSGDPCTGVVCDVGQICIDGQCLSASDESCDPGCGAGEVCQGGRCVSEGGGCDYQGQACARGEHLQWDGQSLCVDWQGGTGANGVCSVDCANQACPTGSTCFALNPGASQSCSGAADCGDRELCYEGQCVVAVCRPSECDISRGVDADCPSGQRCDRLAPGFAMCVRAGNRQVGEECIDAEVANASGRFIEGCVADAICLGGICQAFCEDGDCGGDQECIDADLGDGQKAPVCAATCVPGAEEESACADDETCVPSGAGQGICRPAGELEAFAPCGDGMGLCEPGTICAEQEGDDPLSRCLPVCDLGAAEVGSDGVLDGEGQEARDATCPQPEAGQGLWLAWHLGPSLAAVDLYVDDEFRTTVDPATPAELSDAGNYGLRPEGRVDWRLHEAGAPSTDTPLAEGSFELLSGETKMLAIVPEPGSDRELRAEFAEISQPDQLQWVQGIADLPAVDLWAIDDEGDGQQWLSDWEFGQAQPYTPPEGTYELRLLAAGDDSEATPLAIFDDITIDDGNRQILLTGTVDSSDIHPIGAPIQSDESIADVESTTALALTCRAVNGGSVGACMETCDGLEQDRCSGENMGCGPRYHDERGQWTTVCQPAGSGEVGDSCSRAEPSSCGEGLYCEAQGGDGQGGAAGRCAPLCMVGSDEFCGDQRWCRPLTGTVDYEVGECRARCEVGPGFEGEQCPDGLGRCKPESRLVPTGGGAGGGLDVAENPPLCWAAGSRPIGESCNSGECVPAAECLYDRGERSGYVESLLSPYVGGSGVPTCRAICDPFGPASESPCGDGETCLFNYPWNASVGHCATIEAELAPGDTCDFAGLACGKDSICVDDGGNEQCQRFCEFRGGDADGYERSTCPSGFACEPLVADIGVCR